MLTRADARNLVITQLHSHQAGLPADDELIILDKLTMEKEWGWVFFYTSRKWQETQELRYAIAGNAPLIVEKKSGKLFPTGTAFPVEQYIANYERCGNPNG